MTTRMFWTAVLERAIKSAAQAAALVFGAGQVDAMNVSWADVGGFALGGFVLSVLTSLASSPLGSAGPSVTTVETLADPVPTTWGPQDREGEVA